MNNDSTVKQIAYANSRRRWRDDHPIIQVKELQTFLSPDEMKKLNVIEVEVKK